MVRRPSFLVLAAIMMAMLLWFGRPATAQTTTPTSANLWVGASGSCTRAASAAAYNSATSCSSMQAALSAASGGDTVLILNGTYAGQTLSSGKSTTVSFYAQTYGKVLLTGGLSINTDKVHVVGVTEASGASDSAGGLTIQDSSSTAWTDVLVDGFHGKNAFIAASGVTVKNSEFGNWSACSGYTPSSGSCTGNCAIEDGFRFWSWGPGSATAPSNDKIIDSSIHDVSAPPDGVCGGGAGPPHVDAIQVYSGGSNITIDGVKFYGNATSALQSGGGALSNWTIQNNYFGPTTCCNNLVWGQASCSGSLIVRNNVIANGNAYGVVNNVSCSGSPTYDFSSNIVLASTAACLASGSVSGGYNVYATSGGATCGSNVKKCTPAWLNGVPSAANGYDVRIASTDTCAKGAGNPADYAATDMLGNPRTAPDAGAFAISSGTIVDPATGLTAVVN